MDFRSAPLATIIPSAFVYSNISNASFSDLIFPFPITGIVNLSFNLFIESKSQSPEKNSSLVLPVKCNRLYSYFL